MKNLQIIEKQNFDVSSLDYKKLNDAYFLMQQVASAENSTYFFYDYYHEKIINIYSNNLYFSNSEIENASEQDLNLYFSKVATEDLELIRKIHIKAMIYLKTIDIKQIQNLILIYNCKIKTIKNEEKLGIFHLLVYTFLRFYLCETLRENL